MIVELNLDDLLLDNPRDQMGSGHVVNVECAIGVCPSGIIKSGNRPPYTEHLLRYLNCHEIGIVVWCHCNKGVCEFDVYPSKRLDVVGKANLSATVEGVSKSRKALMIGSNHGYVVPVLGERLGKIGSNAATTCNDYLHVSEANPAIGHIHASTPKIGLPEVTCAPMHTTRRIFMSAIALALVATACSPASSVEVSSTSTTSTQPPTTTTTSTQPPTTTTTTPIESVRVIGEVPSALASAAGTFLSAVQDSRNDATGIDPGLIIHHKDLSGGLDSEYTGTVTMQELETGGTVAVATFENRDILLLADEGTGWHVVGAHLKSTGTDPWFGDAPRRVLVLGSDARPGGDPAVHRMDSIHVVTSIPATGEGTILGWPRDSWVSTRYGEMRINALTSSSRGPDAIFDFFEETWDTQLDGYILTAFSGFEDLIAASVGRLFIELPIAIPTQKWWPGFSSGPQTLTPERSLEYARTRKGVRNGDFSRSKHHGVIMLAVLTMLQQGSVEDVPALVGELVKYTETNLTPTDLIQLGVAALYMDVGEITNEVLPGHLGRAGGGASVVFLEPESEDIIADVIDDGIRNE